MAPAFGANQARGASFLTSRRWTSNPALRKALMADGRPGSCFSLWECYALRSRASSWSRDTQADETEGKKGTKTSFSDRACSS
jgi:hypothetical protein